MQGVMFWLCQRPLDGGWEVYIEWLDGDRWVLCHVDEHADADRVRGKLRAEIDAWAWRSPAGGPLSDPQVPLAVLAALWRNMSTREFTEMWTSVDDERPPGPAGDASADHPELDEEEFRW